MFTKKRILMLVILVLSLGVLTAVASAHEGERHFVAEPGHRGPWPDGR